MLGELKAQGNETAPLYAVYTFVAPQRIGSKSGGLERKVSSDIVEIEDGVHRTPHTRRLDLVD